jgi:hypothetical protein
MLVAMRDKTTTLMQLVRVMQNLLMIALALASMNRTMPLNTRIMLPPPRHLMRMTRMIGRLSHALARRCPMRRHRTLPTTTTLKIALPRMMKTATVLHYRNLAPYIVAVGV